MQLAICPGSFDPVTNGHLDIIERSSRIFDKVLVVVFTNPLKSPLFSVEERVEMLREVTRDLANVEVDHSDGLLSDYALSKDAKVIVKGLRAVSDFEMEFQMARMNQKLAPSVETVFMMTSTEFSYLSSSIVKEVARFGGCVRELVPEVVARRLAEKFGRQAR
ncbi:MAG TPA: pantetheine-phosphate adenylyltransferase [Clostridiales bacterium]|nr:pantetheine-phosphate adenylyltransferase [Clostridiales bacterium]